MSGEIILKHSLILIGVNIANLIGGQQLLWNGKDYFHNYTNAPEVQLGLLERKKKLFEEILESYHSEMIRGQKIKTELVKV